MKVGLLTVSQGLLLKLILFNFLINAMALEHRSMLIKSAANTKSHTLEDWVFVN